MSPTQFREQIAELSAQLAGRPLDASLDAWLNAEHGATSTTYASLKQSCITGAAEGWLCDREGGGIRYGRIFKPAPDLHGYSVDVVDMTDIAGPHHTHPNGEIDLIRWTKAQSLTAAPLAGWSAHRAVRTGPPSPGAAPWFFICCQKAASPLHVDPYD